MSHDYTDREVDLFIDENDDDFRQWAFEIVRHDDKLLEAYLSENYEAFEEWRSIRAVEAAERAAEMAMELRGES